jgi:hypothetical protein
MQGAPPKNKGKPKAFGPVTTPSPTSAATNGFVMVPLSGKFTTPLPSFAPIGLYDPAKDNTLTSTQAKQGSFRPDVVTRAKSAKSSPGDFRFASNPTKSGHSSGYHEAVLPTDGIPILSGRKIGKGGKSTLPTTGRGVWKGYAGKEIHEANVGPVLEASDAARTDTAMTVLSAPGGLGAGHSGSGLRQTGQAPAHDLQRHATMRMLQDKDLDPSAIAVISAGILVYSQAPGERAQAVTGKFKDSKAGATHENRRNLAKRIVEDGFDSLEPPVRKRVRTHLDQFVQSVGDPNRRLTTGRATSPMRDETGTAKNGIQGGGYRATLSKPKPSASSVSMTHAKPSPTNLLLHVSSQFRAERK